MNVSRDEFAVIASLDLEQIKMKLMHRKAGKGWSRARADAAEREYRRFLYLMKKYPNELTAPSMEVDRFWHQHILDTAKYARDCQSVFGYFLHHNPYLGLSLAGDDDALRLSAGQRMRELYDAAFGEPVPDGVTAYANQAKGHSPSSVGRTAYCTVTAEAADRLDASAPAFCTVTSHADGKLAAEPAYCTVAAEPAFCTVTAEPAYCTVTASGPAPTPGADSGKRKHFAVAEAAVH